MKLDQKVRFSDKSTESPEYQNRIGYFQRMEDGKARICACPSYSLSAGECILIPLEDCIAI